MTHTAKKIALLTLTALTCSSAIPQENHVRKDLPSIAQEALTSVVTITTKDANGKHLAQGSGFIVSPDGAVVTNHHVIEGATSGEIHLTDGASYSIEGVLGDSPEKDLALLKIKSTSQDFKPLTIGDSDRVEIGQQVVAIGSPLGLEATVSPGFISGVRELNGVKLIQMTTPISPGSSGGALIDLSGQVVGVPSQTLTFVRQNATVSQNLNFAIPSNYVRELLSAPAKEIQRLDLLPVRTAPKLPNVSVKGILKSSKTLCVSLVSGNPVLKTELSGKLLEWGKLRLVSSPEEADLNPSSCANGKSKFRNWRRQSGHRAPHRPRHGD